MSDYDNTVLKSFRPFGWAANTEQRILQAIFVLKNPMPHQIKKYLDEHKKGYEKSVSLRTIHRVLKKLSDEGTVVHVDGKYSISKTDLRYVGGLLGHLALDCILMKAHSQKTAIDESLRKLVTAFGVLVFYMFIEASKHIKDDSPSSMEKRDTTDLWLEKSFPIDDMFSRFFVTYCEFSDLIKHPYELKKGTIHELTRTLEEQYPYEYKQIQKARNLLTTRVSGNLRELKKGLPDYLSRTGEGVRMKEVIEKLKKHLSEGGDVGEFIIKLAHNPEESQEILKELSKESQEQDS